MVAPLSLCGYAQYWRGAVALAQPGLPLAPDTPVSIPTLSLGLRFMLRFGVAAVSGH